MALFRPMLAATADLSLLRYPIYASVKLDGIRALVKDGQLLSRSLVPVPNPHIQEVLRPYLPTLEGCDGELIVGSPTKEGCFQRTHSSVMKRHGIPEFTYFIFDDFSNPKAAFKSRKVDFLKKLSAACNAGAPVGGVNTNTISDQTELLGFFEQRLSDGYEGLILRGPDAPYKYGRSSVDKGNLLKLKPFQDSEAVIIGVQALRVNGNPVSIDELGLSKRSARKEGLTEIDVLGALVVKDLTTGVAFNLGTGFSAVQRAGLWQQRSSLVGKVVKYKFSGTCSLGAPRHPVFLGFREMEIDG